MKISRRGSFADHGLSSVNIDEPTIIWNKSEKVVEFYLSEVNDFTTSSTYNYKYNINNINKWGQVFILDIFLNTYEALHTSGLSEGTHTFYFGVDMVMNGSLDMGSIYYDIMIV